MLNLNRITRFGLEQRVTLKQNWQNKEDVKSIQTLMAPLNGFLDDTYIATLDYDPKEVGSFASPRYQVQLTVPNGTPQPVASFNKTEMGKWILSAVLMGVYKSAQIKGFVGGHVPRELTLTTMDTLRINSGLKSDLTRCLAPLEPFLQGKYTMNIKKRPTECWNEPIYKLELKNNNTNRVQEVTFESQHVGNPLVNAILGRVVDDLKPTS
jgi:hypothetical protein